jgi:hypothetical protein
MMNKLDQARKYILTAPLAISGRGGHDTTFKVACDLIHGFELADADVLDLMSVYNERLDVTWTQSELRHKVADASNSVSRRPTGYLIVRDEPYKRTPVAPPAQRTTWKVVPKQTATRSLHCRSASLLGLNDSGSRNLTPDRFTRTDPGHRMRLSGRSERKSGLDGLDEQK